MVLPSPGITGDWSQLNYDLYIDKIDNHVSYPAPWKREHALVRVCARTHTHTPRISHTPHHQNTPLHTIPLNRHPTKHMHTHCSHRHAVPLLTNSTTHTPPLTRFHCMHATPHTRPNEHSTTCTISHTYTAVLNTHNIHTYTLLQKLHAYTQSH